jgi:HK97 gp10 family phage protein
MARGSGFFIVFNRIPEVIAEVEANAIKAVADVSADIERNAQARAPVQTGYLRSSIKAQAHGKSAEIEAGAEYAAYVEYGTYKMAARPFLSPAVEAAKDEFFNARRYFPKGSV